MSSARRGQAGEVVSGLVAVFLLFALVTGLLIHLRKLPRDWHTFRPKVKFRHALADAHTVLGLVGIPFTAVYAISGAFLSLLIVLLGPTVLVVFGGDQSRAEALLAGYEMPAHEPAGDTAPMLPFESYFDAAREAWDGHGEPYVVVVHGWGDRAAVAEVRGDTSTSLVGSPRAVFRATTGELLATSEPSWGTPLGATVTGLINLHYARLGPGTLLAKVLYFLLALAAGAVMLSGNVLWLAVRDKQRSSRTHRLLERLTLGVGGGLVVAVPTAFLVSRAITPESAQLVAAENAAFFGTWAAVGLLFALRGRPAAVLSWQLGIAALLSLLVPLANGVTTGAWLWRTAAQRDWNLAVVDAGFLTTALSLGLAAFALRRLGVMASIDRRPIAAPGIG
ncbi:MAG: PepSY-associated TM helix domain-containing protein [Myxococcota bacterium]